MSSGGNTKNKTIKIHKTMILEQNLQITTETAIGYDPLLAVVDIKYSKST